MRAIRRDRISVDSPGPPLVITRMTSSTLNESIRRKSPVTISTGIISGSLMWMTCCQPEAPSMRAASKADRGSDCRAASARMKMNGVHCQMSAMMIEANAQPDSDNQGTGSKPQSFSVRLKMPTDGWYI